MFKFLYRLLIAGFPCNHNYKVEEILVTRSGEEFIKKTYVLYCSKCGDIKTQHLHQEDLY